MVNQYTVANVWGCGKTTRSNEDYYGRKHMKTTYRSNFLLAYDTSSQFELKSLGGREAIERAVQIISSKQDYDLLKRLLTSIESKASSTCTLPRASCLKLLQMTIGKGSADLKVPDDVRISFVGAIIRNLSPEDEPDADLYKAILGAVASIGWADIGSAVNQILSNCKRNRLMTLPIFLDRVSFISKLRPSCSTDQVNQLLAGCCRDLATSPLSIAASGTRIP